MDRFIIEVLLWVIAAGFAAFCTLYFIWNKPWHDRMGRRVLTFMSVLAWSFTYASLSQFLQRPWRNAGWIILFSAMALAIWYSVYILIRYKIEADREENGKENAAL